MIIKLKMTPIQSPIEGTSIKEEGEGSYRGGLTRGNGGERERVTMGGKERGEGGEA